MAAAGSTSDLLFSFAEMRSEIENMVSLARPFLEAETTETVIPSWLQQLRSFEGSPAMAELQWAIPLQRPVRTKLSVGSYEPDDNGEHSVYGAMSAIWEIRIPAKSGAGHKKGYRHANFELFGKASTRLVVWEHRQNGDDRELARWRFEVGDKSSPGCHFHVQILGEVDDKVFPKSMCVPRLPGILFTPMDALEFLLAEIFQSAWRKHAARESDPLRHWARCQRKRLVNLLDWQRAKLASAAGSPWTSLKGTKPDDPNLLLTENKP